MFYAELLDSIAALYPINYFQGLCGILDVRQSLINHHVEVDKDFEHLLKVTCYKTLIYLGDLGIRFILHLMLRAI